MISEEQQLCAYIQNEGAHLQLYNKTFSPVGNAHLFLVMFWSHAELLLKVVLFCYISKTGSAVQNVISKGIDIIMSFDLRPMWCELKNNGIILSCNQATLLKWALPVAVSVNHCDSCTAAQRVLPHMLQWKGRTQLRVRSNHIPHTYLGRSHHPIV